MVKTLLALAATALFAGGALAQDGGKIPWNKDPAAAMDAANASGKPMLLFFTSLG